MLNIEKLENLNHNEIQDRALYQLANAYEESKRNGYSAIDLYLFGRDNEVVRNILRLMVKFEISECTISNAGTDLLDQIGIVYEEGWRIDGKIYLEPKSAWSRTKPALRIYSMNAAYDVFEISEQEAER